MAKLHRHRNADATPIHPVTVWRDPNTPGRRQYSNGDGHSTPQRFMKMKRDYNLRDSGIRLKNVKNKDKMTNDASNESKIQGLIVK